MLGDIPNLYLIGRLRVMYPKLLSQDAGLEPQELLNLM